LPIQNPLAAAIIVAMAAGAITGWLWPQTATSLTLISDIFLRLIRAIIAPVLFGVLVTAVAGAGGVRGLGRIGWKALVYFEAATAAALLIGWGVVVVLQPGAGAIIQAAPVTTTPTPISTVLEQTFPTSIFDAMARGDILQILIFCLLFGAAAGAIGDKAKPVVRFAEALTAVTFQFTRYVMWMAPAAVFAAIASTVAQSGQGVLTALGKFIAAAWIAQLLFLILVIGGSLVVARVPIRRFIRCAQEPFLVAFATTSSAAALPQTLEGMLRLGVSQRYVGIVAPLSLSLNLTGSCIHLAMCAFFVAQATGMHLPASQQLMILLTLKLTSKGVAGIPRANFVILSGLFAGFGLPAEGLTVLLGIDALIDPIRTSVNVLGHCTAVPVIARWEGAKLSEPQ
jgi:proton glutamate symport protein